MGLFDRLKKMLGGADDATRDDDDRAPGGDPEAAGVRARKRGQRPPLGAVAAPSATLDDALEARAAGDKRGARAILQAIDRGGGLRTVLRAAAALEAGDEAEVKVLTPNVRGGDAPWRLRVQLAAALDDMALGDGERFLARAKALGAPAWALAWAGCMRGADQDRRRALVDLLFVEPALARVVAARDLAIEGAHDDARGVAHYASLDAGRVALRRFGPAVVADLLDVVDPEART